METPLLPDPSDGALPRRAWMTEEEFAAKVSESGASFQAALEQVLGRPIEEWTERSLYLLSLEARTMERLLDAHGAQANRAFHPLRKAMAMVLWLSQAISCLIHLQGRLRVYPTATPDWRDDALPAQLSDAVEGLGGLLVRTMEVLKTKWVSSGCEWGEVVENHLFMAPPATRILAADRAHRDDREAQADPGSPVPRLAGRFLRFAESWHRKARGGLGDPAAQLAFAKNFCRERTTRSFQARAHNWQSDYDSLIRGGAEEEEDRRLLCLRGSMSQTLHLLEASTALAHLFERHRPGADPAPGEEESFSICNFLRENTFLKHWIEDGVLLAYRCLEVAVPLAEDIVKDYCEIGSVTLNLPDEVQWHARPLSLVVGISLHHGVPVTMVVEGKEAPANSLIQMLLLVGAHPDARSVNFQGDVDALKDLELLFLAKLGEEGVEMLPPELGYLT